MLIFDRFPDLAHAGAFVTAVRALTGRRVEIYLDADAAADDALFPFELEPPVVLVGRHENLSGERRLEELVDRYGGRFVGT